MNNSDLVAARNRDSIGLSRLKGVGPGTFKRLTESLGDASAVWGASLAQLEQVLGNERAARGLAQQLRKHRNNPPGEHDLRWLAARPNRHLLILGQPDYPKLLSEIANPPSILFVAGDKALLQEPQLAMVGSRNPSEPGRRLAAAMAAELCGSGLTITSGLASGIDQAAHRGALEAGGTTVAVCGTGLDQVYPRNALELAARIAAHGALVTEFGVGTGPVARNFPKRNRIISGLSVGTLVVEANPRSGSLITARLAAEQGREVFAVPGSIQNPLSRGCHALIREGAKLIENSGDVLVELAALLSLPASGAKEPPGAPPTPSSPVLLAMGYDPMSPDEIVAAAGLTASEVSTMLLALELDGAVTMLPDGRYQRQRN